MWRTALMSTPFLWGWERCYKMDVRLVKWQIVSFEGQVDHRWLSDQQQEVLFPGVRAAWGQQHPGQGAGPPPVRPGLQPHQVDGSKLLQDLSLPIRWWADGLCGQVIWVKNKEYSWQQMWLFFRNGIVIIDECPGVALDHFEEKDILIFQHTKWLYDFLCLIPEQLSQLSSIGSKLSSSIRLLCWTTTSRWWLSWSAGTRTTPVWSCGLWVTSPSRTEMLQVKK